jgi:hypothetical protein
MVQIHSPRPILLGPTTYSAEKCRLHPGYGPTSGRFKCARPSASISFSKLELSAVTPPTTLSSFCSPRSPNRPASASAAKPTPPVARPRCTQTAFPLPADIDVCQWIIYVDEKTDLNERNLAQVKMPNRDGFIPNPRPDVPAKAPSGLKEDPVSLQFGAVLDLDAIRV